ncbi:MAG: autoinducer 2 ABC transporter substrate-binding protein [Christensenellales bacterium]|jgi:simple sugar transport system substrate-binding protein|nr:autoinducer 2 ABC transporter substrate-binding protein [Clostridiales bacterium]
MKRMIALLLILCMALPFVGHAEKKTFKIATVVKESSDPWFIRMEEGVKRFAQDKGVNAFQKGPSKTDAAQQVQVIEELIAQGIDAICVVPIDPGACETALKKAMDKGIVVITHEATTIQNADYNIEAFDNVGYGAYMLDELAKVMNEEGEYVCMVSFLTNAAHNEWTDAAIARQREKYPNMVLIPEEKIETEDNMEVAYERTKEIMKAYPNIKGFLGTASNDPPGAGKAIEELGKLGQAFAVGTSVTSVAGPYLESGAVSAATCWDPAEAGYAMNALALMILEGRRDEIKDGLDLGAPGFENITVVDDKYINGQGWIVITKENMSEYDF